jgi:hypothetical protein
MLGAARCRGSGVGLCRVEGRAREGTEVLEVHCGFHLKALDTAGNLRQNAPELTARFRLRF